MTAGSQSLDHRPPGMAKFYDASVVVVLVHLAVVWGAQDAQKGPGARQ